MASHTCEQCGSTVAADEQFCPNCGAFNDPMKAEGRPVRRPSPNRPTTPGNVISVSSDGPYEEFSLDEPPPEIGPEAPHQTSSPAIECPSCSAVNPANNRHCQECGARLQQGPLPTAPRPAVQATAGVRAALAISGLLLGIILFAVLFNVFSGDPNADSSTSTTVTDTTQPINVADPGPIDVLDETCTPEGIGALVCSNLTSGTDAEYQVRWEEIVNDTGEIVIEFTFIEPMAISRIEWTNLDDETRFLQNFRARGLRVRADDSAIDAPLELADQRGTQALPYASISTTKLQITIVSAYDAQVVEENIFGELAIDEIVIIGRPVVTPTSGG